MERTDNEGKWFVSGWLGLGLGLRARRWHGGDWWTCSYSYEGESSERPPPPPLWEKGMSEGLIPNSFTLQTWWETDRRGTCYVGRPDCLGHKSNQRG